jgi:heme A synthase
MLSLLAASYLYWFTNFVVSKCAGTSLTRRARLVRNIVLGQLALGLITLLVGGPVLIKLLHLLVADLLVIAYAALGADLLSEGED